MEKLNKPYLIRRWDDEVVPVKPIHVKQIEVQCTHCGKTITRSMVGKVVRCFDCKMARIRERTKKALADK